MNEELLQNVLLDSFQKNVLLLEAYGNIFHLADLEDDGELREKVTQFRDRLGDPEEIAKVIADGTMAALEFADLETCQVAVLMGWLPNSEATK